MNQQSADSWLRNRLEPGERVLWTGSPNRRAFVFRGPLFFLVPFSILWLGFAVFWEVTVLAEGAPPFFWIWGLAFVIFGIYIAAGRFFVADWEAQRTRYAVTDQRIVMRTGFRAPVTQELNLDDLPSPQLAEGTSGVGTITFGPADPFARWVGPGWPGYRDQAPAFIAIENAAEVFRTIRDARRDAIGR